MIKTIVLSQQACLISCHLLRKPFYPLTPQATVATYSIADSWGKNTLIVWLSSLRTTLSVCLHSRCHGRGSHGGHQGIPILPVLNCLDPPTEVPPVAYTRTHSLVPLSPAHHSLSVSFGFPSLTRPCAQGVPEPHLFLPCPALGSANTTVPSFICPCVLRLLWKPLPDTWTTEFSKLGTLLPNPHPFNPPHPQNVCLSKFYLFLKMFPSWRFQ